MRTRGVVNFIRRWSSSSQRRHRTMAANPVISLGGNRAHTQTTVLGQQTKKPAEPRYSLREPPDHCEPLCGPAEFAGSAHGVFGFMPARFHQPEYLE
jgi:hypothetical protein